MNDQKIITIPVSRPSIDNSDTDAVASTVKSTFIAGGPKIAKFEEQIAKYLKRKYAVAVSNGTQALYIALKCLDLPTQSKILIPSFTIVSALFAVLQCGHKPYFIDVDKDTWNIDQNTVKKNLTGKIAGAIITETYASAPPMEAIQELLRRNHIPMVEDAAEGFGGKEGEKKFGSFGEISIISLYANKLITTGEGGVIMTDNKSIYNKLLFMRNLYFDIDRTFIHRQLSGNFRMTNYQAALGLSQLKKIDKFYNKRKKLYTIYIQLLKSLGDKIHFQQIPQNINSSFWVFPILLTKKSGHSAKSFISKLSRHGIEARHFFYPLDKQLFLPKGYAINSTTSMSLWKYGLYLPLGNGITENEVIRVTQVVKRIMAE